MKKYIKTGFIILLLCVLLLTVSLAKESTDIDKILSETAEYVSKAVKEPSVGSVGGEWAVIALSRSGAAVPDNYYSDYYGRVEKYVKEKKGVLHTKKHTEYSRVVLALSSTGKSPENVSGYNLLTPLGEYDKTVIQGINGPIWALIALDCKGYDIPKNKDAKVQATRQMYVKYILDRQLSDGGWALTGNASDVDVTAMALQALSNYKTDNNVNTAINNALSFLSKCQNNNGGFSSYSVENCESNVQVLVALCSLGIDIYDSRFVKNGNTVLDCLMTYYDGKGAFFHTKNGGTDLMATEQALYGLAALKRFKEGKNSLYSMSDALFSDVEKNASAGLKNKHGDVIKTQIKNRGKTFSDTVSHPSRSKIISLAERGIINGKTKDNFDPDGKMTRAEFATVVVKSLGLPINGGVSFSDVKKSDWFYGYVSTASNYGIIKGVSASQFNPDGSITREEAAVMVTRAAVLCGMNTDIENIEIINILCVFADYVKASSWAQNGLAFCYKEGMFQSDVSAIKPKETVTRAEVADMLYNLLDKAKLL